MKSLVIPEDMKISSAFEYRRSLVAIGLQSFDKFLNKLTVVVDLSAFCCGRQKANVISYHKLDTQSELRILLLKLIIIDS